jgi:bacillithiol biosynthesis cysteine-adding enzyme BshC
VPANQADPLQAGDGSTRIPVDVRRFPWIRKLAADYVYDFDAVAPFFSGDPSDRTVWAQTIARVQSHPREHQQIAAIVHAQQRRRGAAALAIDAGQRLADPRAVAVVTGQQAGLFGGPLFTLLKAITALKLAEQVSRERQVTAVAVFWIEAEDHDWDEVRSCTVFDESLAPRRISLPAAVADATPVARVRLDASIAAALDELERVLAPTEFRAPLLADLRSVYSPGASMVDGFARWLERLLAERGLIVYDASDPAAKPLASRVFTGELSAPGETMKRAARAGADLVARGYHSQAHGPEDGVALFRLDEARRAIRQQDGHFVVGEDSYQTAALVQEATEHPAAFSPSVLLRPIVQDTIFPTICYIAGPNELAYLGQLRGVYDRFRLPMPLMYPRATATLLDSAAVRFLQKYDVPLEALQPQDEKALNTLLEAQIPPSVEESFTSASQAIEAGMTRVAGALPSLDPTLEGAARSTLGRMQHDLHALHGKMIQAAKRRDDTLRRQYMRTQALAFPDGQPQERAIGLVSFLNMYGPALVDRLHEDLPIDLGCHWIVSI